MKIKAFTISKIYDLDIQIKYAIEMLSTLKISPEDICFTLENEFDKVIIYKERGRLNDNGKDGKDRRAENKKI